MNNSTKLRFGWVAVILALALKLVRYPESLEGEYLIGALDFSEVAHAGA